MHPVDEPLGDGDHADVAARLHASLSGPSLAPATRQRHLQAIRTRAATLPAPRRSRPQELAWAAVWPPR